VVVIDVEDKLGRAECRLPLPQAALVGAVEREEDSFARVVRKLPPQRV
jgi:hypothetical protein